MISLAQFYQAYERFRPRPDDAQREAIEQGPEQALFIVAGPGTGKTTCLTLRILKLILVDDVPPEGIVATTFTVKAAAELRSRILGWGFRLIEVLQADRGTAHAAKGCLAALDINQMLTGTIDSICEQLLRDYREPGMQPSLLADDNVAKTLLLRSGLFGDGRFRDHDLDRFLLELHGGNRYGWNIGTKNDLLQQVWERRFQDQVDWPMFLAGASPAEGEARQVLDEALAAYEQELRERGMLDFSLLEQEVLDRLRAGRLGEFLQKVRVVLVDEYQDTNLLQESLYFELAKACKGALAVVGDDDQSLYRFRGATVELFSGFAQRYSRVFRRQPTAVFLRHNYRSTPIITEFVSDYAALDQGYQAVRARFDSKPKPRLIYQGKKGEGLPILGLFRDDLGALAADLAALIQQVFHGEGYRLPNGDVIQRHPEEGDLGDCALLCSSPAERRGDKDRLPLMLREELRERGIETFNPRGQDLTDITIVSRFGGLVLECLDPGGAVQEQSSNGLYGSIDTFDRWRAEALAFAESRAAPRGLATFARGWAGRSPGRPGWEWPRSVPVLDLIYGLLHFFPELYDDPEGQVYLEVFTRQISACEQVGRFSGRVVTHSENEGLSTASVKELLQYFLAPIAAGTIKVNEELMEVFPRDCLSILSIHQAKGLEFPLTIVDVGSHFKRSHPAQAFKRFPSDGGIPHRLEDLLRPYTDLGSPDRSQRDRAFDDLYRQFFVSYSRPQEVLLLVGLEPTCPGGPVENVATGWTRAGACRWTPNAPFILI